MVLEDKGNSAVDSSTASDLDAILGTKYNSWARGKRIV